MPGWILKRRVVRNGWSCMRAKEHKGMIMLGVVTRRKAGKQYWGRIHESERTVAQDSFKTLNMRVEVGFKPLLVFGSWWFGSLWLRGWWFGSWCTCVFVWTLARHDLCPLLFFSVVGHYEDLMWLLLLSSLLVASFLIVRC